MTSSLDWVIVGGGIHGVHIAARLLADVHVPSERLRIVDPGQKLLERWRDCTARTGMTHLRSPSVHHLDVNPWSLRQFASNGRRRPPAGTFAAPYDRPALSLFNDHCDAVIEALDLHANQVRDRVVGCRPTGEAVELQLAGGDALRTRNVVLAIGASEHLRWPTWSPRSDASVQHIFARSFRPPARPDDRVIVVGGGISAAQTALRFTERGHPVTLVCRHPFREHQFDSDPGWLGPRRLAEFYRESRPERRRDLITAARHRGSVPPDVRSALRRARANGSMCQVQGDVTAITRSDSARAVRLDDGSTLTAEHVVLATGFQSDRPGGGWLDALIQEAALPCGACGYPIVDPALRWHPRIRVSGPLAELELGPAARNIAGARHAAERIVQHTPRRKRAAA